MPDPAQTTQKPTDSEWNQVRAGSVVSASISVAVTLFTMIVLARGVGGHLDQSLGGLATFLVYLSLSAVAIGAVWLSLTTKDVQWTPNSRQLPLAAGGIAIVCPLLSVMLLGRDLSAGMLVLFWVVSFVTAGGCLWLSGCALPLPRTLQPKSTLSSQPLEESMELPSQDATSKATPISPSLDVAEDETFSQRWTRRDGEIGDELEGTLKIYFAAGQRTGTADIPIVPAMSSLPDVDCEPVSDDDSDVQVIVRGVHTYGVRLELQRPVDRDEAEEVEVAVLIHAERSGSRDE